MDVSETLNIVIVSNDNYIQHAGVLLTSLFETNRKQHFRVFLLTDGISSANGERLKRLIIAYGNQIEIHIPEKELFDNGGIDIKSLNSGIWNPMIYYKLFIPRILPSDVGRCLFLDVDMVVVDDILPLYNVNLNTGNVIAAVEDVISCVQRKETLGMDISQPYVNSGVMVCDVDLWRSLENEKPIFDFVKEWSDRIINEQDVIAVYFTGKIKLLPIRWNMVGCNYLRQRFVFPKYYVELTEARRHPAIHHFCTLIQPWYADSPHPYRKLYVKYLRIYASVISEPVFLKFPYKKTPKTLVQRLRNQIGRLLNLFDIIRQPGYVLHRIRY